MKFVKYIILSTTLIGLVACGKEQLPIQIEKDREVIQESKELNSSDTLIDLKASINEVALFSEKEKSVEEDEDSLVEMESSLTNQTIKKSENELLDEAKEENEDNVEDMNEEENEEEMETLENELEDEEREESLDDELMEEESDLENQVEEIEK